MSNYISPLLKLSRAVSELETAEVSATLFFGWTLHSELHREWHDCTSLPDGLDSNDFSKNQVLDYKSYQFLSTFLEPNIYSSYQWIQFGQFSHPSWALVFRDYCYYACAGVSSRALREEDLKAPNVQVAWEEMKKHLSVKVMEYLGKPEWRLVAYRGF